MDQSNKITYFAETDARNKRVKFGIKEEDRLRHIYSIGKTGMGKSTMLENMAIQDIQNGNGMAFLDPHGKTADLLLDYIPEERIKDVIYFAPFDTEHPISFNVMEDVGPMRRHLVLSGLMSAFEKVFGEESFSDRMQYILQNTILALLEYPGATLLGINKMLSDKAYRNKVVANVTDPSVKDYWTKEFAGYTDRFAAEAIPAIQNKIGQFTSNPLIRNIIGQSKSSFDLRKVMDEKKILIVNLSKGLVGENNANLLGSMLVTKIYLSAMSRADASASEIKNMPNFYLYVDEFQSFANKSFADILSEARKYKLSLNITHQYIEQMAEEVRAAVFGNVGTMISFRVGSYDAEILEKEFAPVFTMEDIVNLGFVQIYLKLMIDGVASQPFSATTLPPIPKPEISFREKVIEISRAYYTNPKNEVEKTIKEWHQSENDLDNKKEKNKENKEELNKKEIKKEESFSRKEERKEVKIFDKPKIENSNNYKKEKETPKNNGLAEAIAKALKEKEEPENTRDQNVSKQDIPKEEPQKNIVQEKISLNDLKSKNDKQKNSRPPSYENISALKQALNKLQEEKDQPKAQSVLSDPQIVNKKEETKDISKKKNDPKEVPEDVLRKILKGE